MIQLHHRYLEAMILLASAGGLLGCSSSDGSSGTQDNAYFEDCDSAPKLGCVYQGTCHNFYSASSAKQGRADCVNIQGEVHEGGCPPAYSQCCVVLRASFDEPEGICVDNLDPLASDYRNICYNSAEARVYCGG